MANRTDDRSSVIAKIAAMLRGAGRPRRHGMPRWAVVHARQAAEAQRAQGQAAR